MQNFGAFMKRKAEEEKKKTLNPLKELNGAHGDWPHLDLKALKQLEEANNAFAIVAVTIAGVIGLFALVFLITALWINSAHSRDLDGSYAASNPDLHAWFNQLRSDKGLCCDFAEGVKVEDVDWNTNGNTYTVRLPDQWTEDTGKPIPVPGSPTHWVTVPDEAVVHDPNRFGPAVVWPIIVSGSVIGVRCFLPGAGT